MVVLLLEERLSSKNQHPYVQIVLVMWRPPNIPVANASIKREKREESPRDGSG